MHKLLKILFGGLICTALIHHNAFAAPWDEDMFKQQSLKANEIARNQVKGTVPRGYKPFTMDAEQASVYLANPVKVDRNSVLRGRRLYNSNCMTCHGFTGAGEGPVGKQLGTPSLLESFYKSRTDGRFYAVIELGGASMPRYGYKFSDEEQWDIVNYLRFLQGKNVDGVQRPVRESE